MTKLRLIFMTICIFAIFSSAAYASDLQIGVFDTNGCAIVSGQADRKNGVITAAVFNKGNTYQDAENMVPNALIYANQFDAESDGTFAFKMNLKSYVTGEYTLAISQNGKSIVSKSFPYSTTEDNISAIEGLNDAAKNGNIEQYISQNKTALEFSSDYDAKVALGQTAKIVGAEAPFDVNDKEKCVNTYRQAMIASAFSDNIISDIAEVEASLEVLLKEPMKSVYASAYITDKVKKAVVKRLSNQKYSTLKEFGDKVYEAFTLSVTENPTGAGDISAIISALYTDFPQSILSASACRSVANKTYSSIEELQNALREASKTNNTTQPGGNSGSGGTPFKASSSTATPTPAPTPTADDQNKIFDDLDGYDWAYAEISDFAKRGIVSGRGQNKFEPSQSITRAEFVKMIVSVLSLKENTSKTVTFEDVKADDWYYTCIASAYSAGIVNGISDAEFAPNAPITRQDAATILGNCINDGDASSAMEFSDFEAVAEYAKPAVNRLNSLGILSGYEDNTLRPMKNITRAEAVKLLYGAQAYMDVPDSENQSQQTATGQAENINQSLINAYSILQYLGIMSQDTDFTQLIGKDLTRGDFALYLSRAVKLPTFENDGVFSDVELSTEKGHAISSVAAYNIMSGYGDGTFRPDEVINATDMTLAGMRALGYHWSDRSYDNYYITKAQALDLLDGVKSAGAVTIDDCVVFLYNLIHTNTVSQIKNGGNITVEENDTPLKLYFNLEYVKGIVTANVYAGLDGTRTAGQEYIEIDNVIYKTDIPSIAQWLGYKVIAYYAGDDDDKSIVYFIEDRKNEVVTIDSDEFDSFDGGAIRYTSEQNGAKKRISIASDVVIIRNSCIVTTDYEKAFDIDYGTITCISYNSKCSTVIIDAYENYKISGIDTTKKIIYTDRNDENGNPVSINLDDKLYVGFVMLPYGKTVNETNLEAGDLISVAASQDGEVIRAYLCTDSVNGTLESVNNGGEEVQISGKKYKADPYFYKEYKPELGMSGEFIFDAAGRVAAYSQSGTDIGTIGYLYKLYDDEDDESTNVKIYTLDRRHILAKLSEKVTVDGKLMNREGVKQMLCTKAGGELQRQIVMYKLNSEGNIATLTTAAPSKEERLHDDTLYTLLPKGSYTWYYQMKTFERKYPVSNKTYYMRVPMESESKTDELLFGCQPFSNVTWYNSNGEKNIMGLYKFKDDTPYADIMLVQNTDTASLTNQTEITVISSIKESVSADGDNVVEVHGYRRGNEVTAYILQENYRGELEVGDIFRFATDIKGYAGAYELVYDYSEVKVMWEQGSNANEYTSNISSATSGLRYTFGYVNNLYLAPYSSGVNSLLQIGPEPGTTYDTYQINSNESASTRYIIVDSSRTKNKVYMGDLYEANAFDDCRSEESTSRAFVHVRSGWLIAVIIYK